MLWATDTELELELKSALQEGKPLSSLAPLLLEALESEDKAKKNTAIRFLQLHPEWPLWENAFKPWLQEKSQWPWELILSWLTPQRLTLSLQDRKLLYETLEKQNTLLTLASLPEWKLIYDSFSDLRQQSLFQIQKRIFEVRDLLFEELRTWKSQRLHEQEIIVLERLKTRFPEDTDIRSELEKFRQNQAIEVLNTKIRKKRSQKIMSLEFADEITQLPEEWEQQLLEYADRHPEQTYDLCIACCFIEDWVTALKLINKAESSSARDWLELDILLKLKRYIDVLQALHVIEQRWSHEGETFFATAYVRAQALYGLGQKEKALEVLESLLASRPLYRQGLELLHIWRGSLS